MRRLGASLAFALCSLSAAAQEPVMALGQPRLNFVEQAAAALVAGRDLEAAELMEKHVQQNPSEIVVRAQLAELLFRLESYVRARRHFEVFLAAAQDQPDIAFRYLIHSHSRLVEIGEKLDLPFDEHLHRGVGLYLLAGRRATEPNPSGEFGVAELLGRAARELQAARHAEPEQAQAHFYLSRVWSKLGQTVAAKQELADADRLAATSPLTPRERRELAEACLTANQFAVRR